MRIQIVMNLLGRLLLAFSVLVCIPLLYGVAFESVYYSFALTAILSAILGSLFLYYGIKSESFGLREGFLIVSATWFITGFLGALPFYFSGIIPNFTDALFESVSGLTATGASVIHNVDEIPKTFILWRGLTHWIGGMGIIVLVLSYLKNLGADAGHLLNAEASVPVPGLIMPRIRYIAKNLWVLYIVLTVLCFLCLVLGGMSAFEALNYSFSVIATGGFAPTTAGMFAYAHNEWIKWTMIVFMALAGGNFTVYLAAYQNSAKEAFKDFEYRIYMTILLVSSILITLTLCFLYPEGGTGYISDSVFTVVSIQTGSGFSTVDYDKWPEFTKAILFTLMFIGGCSGSTAGGIKVIRVLIVLKSSLIHLRRAIHPGLIQAVRINGKVINEKRVMAAQQFFFLYMLSFFISTLLLTASGVSLNDAVGAVAGILGNVGLAFGSLGPTESFSTVSPFAKLVLIIDMILGILEIFTLLVLLHPDFWDSYFVKKKVRRLQ